MVNAQNILPLLTDEYCPDTEYTFTANLPKPYSSMIGEGGCYLTQSPSGSGGYTITFKGKFGDVNQKQTFRVYYNDGTNYSFDFKKIKSLFYGACTAIQPNQSTITALPCQTANHSISFNNVHGKQSLKAHNFVLAPLQPMNTFCLQIGY